MIVLDARRNRAGEDDAFRNRHSAWLSRRSCPHVRNRLCPVPCSGGGHRVTSLSLPCHPVGDTYGAGRRAQTAPTDKATTENGNWRIRGGMLSLCEMSLVQTAVGMSAQHTTSEPLRELPGIGRIASFTVEREMAGRAKARLDSQIGESLACHPEAMKRALARQSVASFQARVRVRAGIGDVGPWKQEGGSKYAVFTGSAERLEAFFCVFCDVKDSANEPRGSRREQVGLFAPNCALGRTERG